jgi:enhancing lycopene biosynthesis protein 2
MNKSKEILNEGSRKAKKRNMLIICLLILFSLGAIIILVQTKSLDIVSQPNYDEVLVPQGYTFNTYTVEEVTGTSCQLNSECETPASYLIQSRCPFTSICLENKCTVVCPTVDD